MGRSQCALCDVRKGTLTRNISFLFLIELCIGFKTVYENCLRKLKTHAHTHTLSQDNRGTIMSHFREMFPSDRKCFLLIFEAKIEINVCMHSCVSVSPGGTQEVSQELLLLASRTF